MTRVLDRETTGEICLGPLDLIARGEGRRFVVEGLSIAVFRQRDGSLFATEDRCPHLGGPLSEGVVGGGQVICPYHSYRFDLATGACANDSSCSLRTYAVHEERGMLLLRL
jgi:nitrite reductase (NADH) small subunit